MIKKIINKTFIKRDKYTDPLIMTLIFSSILLIRKIVYISGGTNAMVHLMYIPILFSLLAYGIKAGLFFSIIAGLSIGPGMPMVVSEGIPQSTVFWVFRIFMFMSIVLIVGTLLNYLKTIHEETAYTDVVTGFPNFNKFKTDVEKLIFHKKKYPLSVIIFEFTNKKLISQYIDYNTANKSFLKLLKLTEEYFDGYSLYVANSDKFGVVLPSTTLAEANRMAHDFSKLTKKPLYIDALPISAIVKGGIVTLDEHNKGVEELLNKLNKVLNQPSQNQDNVIIYDSKVEEEQAKYYNTLLSLYHSLQNDMFTLVYQPKIRVLDGKVEGVEALLRIKEGYDNISITQLITAAEEVGFINEITKWVIYNAISQVSRWDQAGLKLRISVNLSSLDLKDCSIMEYTLECLKLFHVSPRLMEFELTERTIVDNKQNILDMLSQIKKLGIKVSLDDYGSGYNSLNYLAESFLPFDSIKIDKSFIDNVTDESGRILCKGIIDAAHLMGIEVVAEGVETAEQVRALKDIGCDIFQGYYFSKPLPAEKLVVSKITKQTFQP